ncbi:hypothetical protein WJX73_009696 [Symbiochloris irregularis]|uniref:Uncharacterized protein n=1 Tax=Symbiochloris irregularis TaxID=706552 RepID=A0AAW1NQS0_9CHLO
MNDSGVNVSAYNRQVSVIHGAVTQGSNRKDALKRIDKHLKKYPGDPVGRAYQAWVFALTDRKQKANEIVDAILREAIKDAKSHANWTFFTTLESILKVLGREGDDDEALAAAKEAAPEECHLLQLIWKRHIELVEAQRTADHLKLTWESPDYKKEWHWYSIATMGMQAVQTGAREPGSYGRRSHSVTLYALAEARVNQWMSDFGRTAQDLKHEQLLLTLAILEGQNKHTAAYECIEESNAAAFPQNAQRWWKQAQLAVRPA